MADDPRYSGWLPPRPPGGQAPAAPDRAASPGPPRAPGPGPYRPVQRPPSSPSAVLSIVVGATAVALLLLSAGTAFFLGGLLGVAAGGLGLSARRRLQAGQPGRPRQIRVALIIAGVAVSLALVAAVTWTVLEANGITRTDLQQALERERDRLQSR